MFNKELTARKYMRYHPILLINFLVVISITSWGCGNSLKKEQIKIKGEGRGENKKEDKEEDKKEDKEKLKVGGLTMSLTKTDLIGDAKETEAIFSLAQGDETADLTKFNVRITVTEIGGSGSSINYTDSKKTSRSITQSLQESIVHFFPITELASYKNPLKVLFTLVPGPKVSSLKLRFELLDTQNKILKEEIVGWKPKPAGIKLKLTPLGPTNLSSGNRLIRFKIEREPGSEDINPGKLQLMINEESGSSAKIIYNEKTVTVLSGLELGAIGDEITLVIESSKVMAVFKLQIRYNGNKVGKSERFTWTELTDDPSQEFLSAIITGDIIKMKQLLFLYGPDSVKPSIDINTATSYKGRTPLHFAVEKNNQAIIEMVLGVPGIDVNRQNMEGFTPLHMAMGKAKQEMMNQLLGAKVIDVNAKDKTGDSPLHKALRNNNTNAIIALLAKGANVNAVTCQGKTPLHLAVERGDQSMIEILLQAKGIEVNAQAAEGKTPLHLAVGRGDQSMVEKLLQTKGIEVNAQAAEGKTPLHLAVELGNQSIVEKLLQAKGIKVNAQTAKRKTPLHLAVELGDQSMVEKLLRAKAIKVNAQTAEGKTPLHLAVELGNQSIIEKLLSVKKINIELKDNSGNTPLYRAFQKKNKSAIQALTAKKEQLQKKSR